MALSDRPVKAKQKFSTQPVVGRIGRLVYGYDGGLLLIRLVSNREVLP